jgi:hypothetical protein
MYTIAYILWAERSVAIKGKKLTCTRAVHVLAKSKYVTPSHYHSGDWGDSTGTLKSNDAAEAGGWGACNVAGVRPQPSSRHLLELLFVESVPIRCV